MPQIALALLFALVLAGCSAASCPDDGKLGTVPCRGARGPVVTVTSGGSVAVGGTIAGPK